MEFTDPVYIARLLVYIDRRLETSIELRNYSLVKADNTVSFLGALHVPLIVFKLDY